MSQKIQFKAESKRLLDLMINSIYTNREIFLRELLSNANDALSKLHFKSLTDSTVKSDFSIFIEVDKDKRTISISDTGIGMTKDDLEKNLGTIAQSDSFQFKNNNKNDAAKIVGQFGVGFYSAFMVAKKVIVETKAWGSNEAFLWESEGVDGYTITPITKQNCGTKVTLELKDNTENEKYDEFLDKFNIKHLVKKYSDYLEYPIKMECEHSRKKDNIDSHANNKDNVDSHANNKDNVDSHTGNKDNVDSHAGNKDNVDSHAGNKDNIDSHADNKDNVDSHTDNKDNIDSHADNKNNVDSHAGNKDNIDSHADNKNNIDSHAGNKDNVDSHANNKDNIDSHADNKDNIDSHADNKDNIDSHTDSEDEYETYTSIDTINSMTPIWKKDKKDVSQEEMNEFYKNKFFDFTDPAKTIQFKTEGTSTFSALLFIPANTPFNYYTKDYAKGLQLYSNGVLITEKCAEMLPDYFSFVRGIIDSVDIQLNISRETLQQNQQIRLIAKNIEKKIKNELLSWQKNNRAEFEKFFDNFGTQLKYGTYIHYGINKEKLQDLLLFYSSKTKAKSTLKEYVSRMKPDQNFIYYACGETISKIENMPQMEFVKEKDFEVLFLTEDIDEFAIKSISEFEGKKFANITSNDLDFETDEEKKQIEELTKENENLIKILKDELKDKISDVKISNRIKNCAVCLTTQGDISIEMEKVLNSMPNNQKVSSQKVLEINKNHAIFKKLCDLEKNDVNKLKLYANLLYTQAALIEGIIPTNPVEFSNQLTEIMSI